MPNLEGREQLVAEEPGYLNTWVNTYTVAHPQKHCVMHTEEWNQY
jgi:hypothetical protein